MKTRSALPTLALAALLSGLVPVPETRAEPDKPAVEGEATPAVEYRTADLAERRAKVAELTRTLGPEHADTIAARRALAEELFYSSGINDDSGKMREYVDERRALLALAVRVHGAGDPATFEDWRQLAQVYRYLRKYNEAATELRALVAAMAKALGPEDGKTLEARQALAAYFEYAFRFAEAEREVRALVAIYERSPATKRQVVKELRSHLAFMLDLEGRPIAAEIEYRLLLAALEEESGDTRMEEMRGRESLAKCLLDQGRGAEALQELEFIQAHREEEDRVGGPKDESFADLLEKTRKALAESTDENPAPAPAKPDEGEKKAEPEAGE